MPQNNRELYFALFFVIAFLSSYFLSWWVRKLAWNLAIRDLPDSPRKIHTVAKVKSGGVAIFFSFIASLLVLAALGFTDEISGLRLGGLVAGAAILIIGGILDDKYDLRPAWQISFPITAALVVVLSGTHISYITNPFGGAIVLDQYKFFGYPLFGSLLVFAWLMAVTYTTKFLDGMDGLVTGVSGIGSLMLFAISLAPNVDQTTTALLALIFAGSLFGFLPHNFFPAKIFLGEGGSTLTGFIIAALAVISGGKIATALLVLGIPLLDAGWVIVRRLWFGDSPFAGDKKHLHFRLLDIGLSQRQATLFLYLLAAVFGGLAVFLQSIGKLVALGAMLVLMVLIVMAVVIIYKKKHETPNPKNSKVWKIGIWSLFAISLLGLGILLFEKDNSQMTKLTIGNVELQVEIADDSVQQYQGLSGRESLCQNCGMLFAYDEPARRNFIMRGMRFPLDIIFLRDQEIAEIYQNIPHPLPGEEPQRISSRGEADAVLEVNAGFAETHALKIGDQIKY